MRAAAPGVWPQRSLPVRWSRSVDLPRCYVQRMGALTVQLRDPAAVDLAVAGGKAAGLGDLVRAGFSVPDGFVVTTAAYRLAAAALPGPLTPAVVSAASVPDLVSRAIHQAYAAALCQQLFEVAVGQAVAQVPAHRQQDHLGWKPEAAEARGQRHGRSRTAGSLHRTTLTTQPRSVNATEPFQEYLFAGAQPPAGLPAETSSRWVGVVTPSVLEVLAIRLRPAVHNLCGNYS